MSDEAFRPAIEGALAGMAPLGPRALRADVNRNLEPFQVTLDEDGLLARILAEGAPESTTFHLQLLQWDAAEATIWTGETAKDTVERRSLIFDRLGLSHTARTRIDETFPVRGLGAVLIANPEWEPWYTTERATRHQFYWNAYKSTLTIPAESIKELDAATTAIVARLNDPTSASPYQSKGLVVGHVQSGKTANFTGVIAKAIDAGYRLIIVLTGTYDILRNQTQRRLDKELIGRENILGGVDEKDTAAIIKVDYANTEDRDWLEDKFLRHGVRPIDVPDVPSIRRLTTSSGDYKALAAGLPALDFQQGHEIQHRAKPLWHTDNLFGTDVRLAVVKKNKGVLEKLVSDLTKLHINLGDIPTLIIDDEADLASVNTTMPGKIDSEGRQARTAINKKLSELLALLKRSQYVGYTATPFANVFVDPTDTEDIFPRDFILSLQPPPQYMGGVSFHDLRALPEGSEDDPAISNRAAFVRDLDDRDEDEELAEALDAFVVTGAIKLWREANGQGTFYHHTMLVHESVRTEEHRELRERIDALWLKNAYSSPTTKERLRELYENDFHRVWASRDTAEWGATLPDDFDAVWTYVGQAVDRMTVKRSPVVVVNGDKNADYEQLDFQGERVWRILVGGAKLSRGFTVEELTITYYRRRALAADSLMQMGRWFGYRKGYRDLVRLYIARRATDNRGREYDLYGAFESILRDEEDFRAQLRTFAQVTNDGHPVVRPIDVPPLVFQELPWLKPTARNKMYNAELDVQGQGGIVQDFPRQPDRDANANPTHFNLVRDWVERLSEPAQFTYRELSNGLEAFDNDQLDDTNSTERPFLARYAIVPAAEVRERLAGFQWTPGFNFAPHLRFMDQAIETGTLTDWAVLVPELSGNQHRNVDGVSVAMVNRIRRGDRAGFSGSSFRQRHALQHIAGHPRLRFGGPVADDLSQPGTRGAVLLTFAADPVQPAGLSPAEKRERADHKKWPQDVASADVATLFSMVLPYASAPEGRLGFRVRQEGNIPIVDVPKKK